MMRNKVRLAVLWLVYLASVGGARERKLLFHGEYVDDMACTLCHSDAYCPGDGTEVFCPAHSASIPSQFPSTINDCICDAGFLRQGDVCNEGTAPFYYTEGIQRSCPTNMLTITDLAPSILSCVCKPGFEITNGVCTRCPLGEFKEAAGNETCTDCAAGTISNFTGATSCFICPANTYSLSGDSACTDCRDNSQSPPGTTSGTGCLCNAGYELDLECVACASGTYKDTVSSMDTCTPCAADKTSPVASISVDACVCNAGFTGPDGAEACSACLPGTYKEATGSAACENCAEDTYSDTSAATVCTECIANSSSVSGSDSVDDCVCDLSFTRQADENGDPVCIACLAGKFASGNECVDCEAGKISVDGAIECTACGAGETSVSPFIECVCDLGYTGAPPGCLACASAEYKDVVGTAACTTCPTNAAHTEQTASTAITDCKCEPGFFAPDPGTLHACEACAGGTYSTQTAATKCLNCVPTYPYTYTKPADAPWTDPSECSACTLCADDFYDAKPCQGANASVCLACPSNSGTLASATTIDPNTGITSCSCDVDFYGALGGACTSCGTKLRPAGRIDSDTAVTDCLCPVGEEPVPGSNTECSLCEIGKFKTTVSNDACSTCEQGFTTIGEGAEFDSLCVCDVGTFLEGGVCVPCAVGSYKNFKGNEACVPCPTATSTTSTGSLQCLCEGGQEPQNVEYELIVDSGKYRLSVGGEERPTLAVPRGIHAGFTISITAPEAHPLRVSAEDAWKAPEYAGSTRVGNTVELQIPIDFDGLLYYYCDLHDNMGGVIQIQDTWPCAECSVGFSKAVVNNSLCTGCETDFFAHETGSLSCTACADNAGTHGATAQAICRCDAGFERKTSPGDPLEVCLACDAGKFKASHEQLQCAACSECTELNQRLQTVCTTTVDTICDACQNNSHLPAGIVSDTFCYCHAGYEANYALDACTACSPGTARASNFNNTIMCEPCDAGSKALQPATTVCVPCEPNCADVDGEQFYVSAECTASTSIVCTPCTLCEPGFWSIDTTGMNDDTTCGVDFHNDRNDTQCQQCLPNHFCEDQKMFECTRNSASPAQSSSADDCICNPSYFKDTDGACQLCGIDTYCAAGVSNDCPQHSFYNFQGASSVLQCTCQHGFYRDHIEQYENGTGQFTCLVCEPNSHCFNNSIYECPDDRQVSVAGSHTVRNCTCIDGHKNSQPDWQSCIECGVNVYCRGGYEYACGLNRWTNNLIKRTQVEDCLCIPGMFENDAGICEPCPHGYFCPGTNERIACPSHATSDLGATSRAECKCNPGFTNSTSPDGLICVQCEAGSTFKTQVGNVPCSTCKQCKAIEDQYEYSACVPTADAVCDACETCSSEPGFYIQQACTDKTNAVCGSCTVCDYATKYEATACRPDQNTICENIDFNSPCATGFYRGGHTQTSDSVCRLCQYNDTKFLDYTLHMATGDGETYNDAYSCPIACLGNSKLRSLEEPYLGCESCESGNALLKQYTVSTTSTTCDFTCIEDYVLVEDNCVTPPLKASTANAGIQHNIAITNYERTADGNTFTVEHTNHSRFIVVVGATELTDCRGKQCCYANYWRVSQLNQAGFPSSATSDSCSRSDSHPLQHDRLSSTSLKFSIPDVDLAQVGSCRDVNGSTVCDIYVSQLDTVLSTTVSAKVVLTLERAQQHVFFVKNQQYIKLDQFDAQVFKAYTTATNEQVYILKLGVSGPVYDIRLRVQSMTQMTEIDNCDNMQFGSNAQYLTTDTFTIGQEHTTYISYWKGGSSQVVAYLSLLMGPGNDQDIAVSRNMQLAPAVCDVGETNTTFSLASIRSVSGMGKSRMKALFELANTGEATHGELGELFTFAAQSYDTYPLTFSLQNLLALYTRSDTVDAAIEGLSAVTNLNHGSLQFTYDLRTSCRQHPDACAYQSWHPHLFQDDAVHILQDCSAQSQQAARQWLRTEFGVPHDGDHVLSLCQHFAQQPQHSYQGVLVHSTRYLPRTPWHAYFNSSMTPIHVRMWANFHIV